MQEKAYSLRYVLLKYEGHISAGHAWRTLGALVTPPVLRGEARHNEVRENRIRVR